MQDAAWNARPQETLPQLWVVAHLGLAKSLQSTHAPSKPQRSLFSSPLATCSVFPPDCSYDLFRCGGDEDGDVVPDISSPLSFAASGRRGGDKVQFQLHLSQGDFPPFVLICLIKGR